MPHELFPLLGIDVIISGGGCSYTPPTTPGLVPEQVLWLGQAANIPMVVLGKMIQVIANFRQGQRFFDQADIEQVGGGTLHRFMV